MNKDTYLIRSWLSTGSFNEMGVYSDRNFGILPKWFKTNGINVFMYPMYFSLNIPMKDIYAMAKKQNILLLNQHHYNMF